MWEGEGEELSTKARVTLKAILIIYTILVIAACLLANSGSFVCL